MNIQNFPRVIVSKSYQHFTKLDLYDLLLVVVHSGEGHEKQYSQSTYRTSLITVCDNSIIYYIQNRQTYISRDHFRIHRFAKGHSQFRVCTWHQHEQFMLHSEMNSCEYTLIWLKLTDFNRLIKIVIIKYQRLNNNRSHQNIYRLRHIDRLSRYRPLYLNMSQESVGWDYCMTVNEVMQWSAVCMLED